MSISRSVPCRAGVRKPDEAPVTAPLAPWPAWPGCDGEAGAPQALAGASGPRQRVGAMRPLRYVVCDVFTDRALTGNQLAVFTDARDLDDALMQALAREMNFAESTFVLPAAAGGHARIRIFTPRVEVPFAGHPTLGTAFVVGEATQLRDVVLETGAGLVPVRLEREGAQVRFGWMTQPVPQIAPFARA